MQNSSLETFFPTGEEFVNRSINNSSIQFFTDFDIWNEYLNPSKEEWVFIFFYFIVFVVSLTGNILILIFIQRRKNLRTTVNYFVLNLALADILVTLICLPPTLMVDFFKTWLLGNLLCKCTPYLQMVVTCVSSLSLGTIAVNRWFVVCHPMKAVKFGNLKKASAIGMLLIWCASLLALAPVPFKTKLNQRFDVIDYPELNLLKNCVEDWQSDSEEALFHLFFIIFCYALPLLILAIAYTKIFQELHHSKIPGEQPQKCTLCKKHHAGKLVCSKLSNAEIQNSKLLSSKFTRSTPNISSNKNILLASRRRCAFMQVTLIFVFGFCYAPVMILDFVRRVVGTLDSTNRDSLRFVFAFAHFLMYLNSALNPIIYNFFSEQLRKEFKKTFCCFSKMNSHQHRSTDEMTLQLSRQKRDETNKCEESSGQAARDLQLRPTSQKKSASF